MNPKPYPSDLTSQQWAVLKPLLPPARTGGRPRKTEMRSVVNAIFYRNRNGCIWRALPHDFPPWRTVYNYFAAWKRDGTWKVINDALRRRVRRRAGRQPTPTPAVSIARPSRRPKGVASMVTTVPSGSPVGSIISPWIPWGCSAVAVTSAAVDDATAAPKVLGQLRENRSLAEEVVGDTKYHNHVLNRWVSKNGWYVIEIVSRLTGDSGLSCCRGGGWWSEPSAGWVGAGFTARIMNT